MLHGTILTLATGLRLKKGCTKVARSKKVSMFTFVCNASKQGRQAPTEVASAPKFRLHVETVAAAAKMLQRFQRLQCATETSVEVSMITFVCNRNRYIWVSKYRCNLCRLHEAFGGCKMAPKVACNSCTLCNRKLKP